MQRLKRYLTFWPAGWLALPFGVALAFCGSAFAGFVLLQRGAGEVIPMSGAVAVGAALGHVWGILRRRAPKKAAWPAEAPPYAKRD